MNLIETWQHHKNQSHFVSSDELMRYAKHWTKDTMRNNLIKPYRWWRDANLYDLGKLKTLRHNRKTFGKSFGIAVRADDLDYALELANERMNGFLVLRDPCQTLRDKFGGYYSVCDDCDTITTEDYACSVNNGDRCVCQNCRDNNYHWSDYHDGYVDDDYDDERDREYDNIGEYHSSSDNLGRIPSKYDNRKPRVLLGLELEMEIKSDYDLDDRAGKLLSSLGDYHTPDGQPYTYALCELDGSLDNGFEMVTAYTGLDVHKEQLQFFKEPFKGAKSHDTDSCGLHIHICKADMSTLHACKMVLFINDEQNHKLVHALARRDSNSYSRICDKKTSKHWLKDAVQCSKNALRDAQKRIQLKNLNSSRYEALNFHNEKTIEFRLFKGTLKYQTLMACLEFTFATWHFCKDASQTELTTPKFLEFICKAENRSDTRFLRTYLREKGFELPEKLSKAKPANVKELAISI